MQIFRTLDHIPLSSSPRALTIGNFDALHLGHQALLKSMGGSERVVVTFSNHPSTVLSTTPKLPILTLPHKLRLLEHYGIDIVVLLPFTKELAGMSAEAFLSQLHSALPFHSLVLGFDARLGHKREGDPIRLQKVAHTLSFSLSYLPQVLHDALPVSTSRIRAALQKGDDVTPLLGRPYSIRGTVERGESRGKKIGFPTLNLDVRHLALPPLGVWQTTLIWKGESYPAVSNLGFAPTVRQSLSPLLEVHIPGFDNDLYDEEVEVVFGKYLRPEKRFLSLDDLKNQIACDIQLAK